VSTLFQRNRLTVFEQVTKNNVHGTLTLHSNETPVSEYGINSMVTLRRSVLYRISQVKKSMKWLMMSMLSLISGKGLSRILNKMTCRRNN
jgi:hypothetical protein